jgi:hypothetical protein
MSRDESQPLFNARPSDDPYFRIAVTAEKRARQNGVDVATAVRCATELLRAGNDHEQALTVACGEYRRAA